MFAAVAPSSPVAFVVLLFCFVLVLAFEFSNGFHDTANAVATVIYTHSLKPVPAVVLSGTLNFLGVMLGDVAVDVSSVEMVSRWPLFAGSVIRDVHVVRVCAVPMHGGADVLGVLTLSLAHAGPFAFGRRELAFLADAAASALSARSPADHLVTQLAWDGRSAVNRATGMVMAQLAIPAVDALALMRAHAYAIDATLQDVARQVLQRTLVFRPPDRP